MTRIAALLSLALLSLSACGDGDDGSASTTTTTTTSGSTGIEIGESDSSDSSGGGGGDSSDSSGGGSDSSTGEPTWDLGTCEGVLECAKANTETLPPTYFPEYTDGIFDCFPGLDPDQPERPSECDCFAGAFLIPTFCD